ncbi:putative receptor-like protein kinase At3g47110 [Durio zibethinus]|uniref:non-specific serine/threonine protein kinase n=1 Tax=Durio zibethinus TaxID=66656 RepID=A0A6P5Y1C2_DURZI|nr:putative receptor-like protein kinase At3g47110 [Durio zibethinus]
MNDTYFHFLSFFFMQCFMASLAMTVRNLTTDHFALLEFKHHILDPHNVLVDNWTASSSVCNWLGVSCGVRHGRVTSLTLPNMNLTGTIPPHLGNLSFLLSLDLSNNNFYGNLPNELGQLHRLRFIHLSFNSLNGVIPSWLGKLHRVEELRMSNNNFTGTIPQTLVNMSNLEILGLGTNQLSGQIPSPIFKISPLKEIYVQDNSLSGSLPDDLCVHLPKLEVLYLFTNALSGYIPSSIGRCSKLQSLALTTNQFKGFIPRIIGNLTSLKEVYLGLNKLEGEIPEEIGNLFSLETLGAGDMGLTGQIPASIFNISSLTIVTLGNNRLSSILPDDMCHHLPKLKALFLYDNQLSGNIPSSIGKCNNLQYWSLARNQFTGLIPISIGNLTMLKVVDLAGNKLEGNFPPMTTVRRLERLLLWGNNLSGNILNSISNASLLKDLELQYNFFSGIIPNSLGNLRHLELLEISHNHLTTKPATHGWSFLSSLANCKKLITLSVSGNPLHGILPTYIGNLSTSLQNFYAAGCELQGHIPLEVGNLSNLFLLDLSDNKISGSIPVTIGGLRNFQALNLEINELQEPIPQNICSLQRLFYLGLSYNKLEGPMPTCLGNLTSLRILILGSNKLSSTIPSTLWSLKDILTIDLSSNYLSSSHPLDIGYLRALTYLNLSRNLVMSDISSTIGSLETLVSLDLSNNKFQGHIPESFGGLISLESLDLCNNNISGVIPKSLEKLLNLKYFNVSYNRLEGEIPNGGQFRNFSNTSFMNNYALCGPPRLLVPPCKSGVHKNSKKTILRVLRYGLPTIGTIVLIIVFTIMYRKCQSRSITLPVKESLLSLKTWRRISHAELSQATDGFDECNLLGSGSFGSVYKGRLLDGMNVAIKVFNLQIEGAFRSFDTECEALRNIVHRNLVKVITCCSNVDFKALVLDFMLNGSLEKWLHSENHFLDMLQRINIMIDVASALEYLHAGQPTPIVHCDLKPSNILLDEDMVAHLGDFGIAKLLEEDDFMRQTMTLATIGYMAPEFGSAGIVSVKCDIYSYGILLIETFTKKKPTDEIFSEALTMRHWMQRSLSKGIIDIADANLLRRDDEYFIIKANCISSIMELALKCSAELPEDRNNIVDVVTMLKKIKQKFLISIEQV